MYDLGLVRETECKSMRSFKVNGTCRVFLLKRFRDVQLISVLNFSDLAIWN